MDRGDWQTTSMGLQELYSTERLSTHGFSKETTDTAYTISLLPTLLPISLK